MKYLKIGKWGLAALGVIVVACGLRVVLISQNWPMLNSDEGTMGIMARHIAYQGEWPIFFYGQAYMGVLQAYVGAFLFHLFGASLFSLRLGLVLMNLVFLGCMYLLTRALYTRPFALFIVGLLAFGSYYMLEYQLHAYGGYSEILICGTVAFLLASKLAITSSPFVSWHWWRWRFLHYAGWGFVVSLGLWSDSLILPLVVASGFLLLLFCWRELLRIIPALCILLGLCIGAIPLIIYNLNAAPGQDSFSVLWRLQHGGSHSLLQYTLPSLIHALKTTTLTSIPMITGNPFCPISEEVDLHDPTTGHMLKCTLAHVTWGGGYLLLFAGAFLLATWAVWIAWRATRKQPQEVEGCCELARSCARYLLLCSALIAFAEYVVSNAPVTWPGVEARYLIGLWLVWPVVLWPLWCLARPAFSQLGLAGRTGKIAGIALLACLVVMSMVGSVKTLTDIPRVQADYQNDMDLVQHLKSIHVTHIYVDSYWSCNKLAFLSQEQIICGVVDDVLLTANHNRVPGYFQTVYDDPHSAYVFPIQDQVKYVVAIASQHPSHYQRYVFDGYVVYQPIGNATVPDRHIKKA